MGKLRDMLQSGERVTPLVPSPCYYAHLSVYQFARELVSGKVILDVGSGTGYGSSYFIDAGARQVHGIEIDQNAFEFSKKNYPHANLVFHNADIIDLSLDDSIFDMIFSSNVFEHIPDIRGALDRCWRVLKPSGSFVLAVPPIRNVKEQAEHTAIPFHLNIWSPKQWNFVLNDYFESIQVYRHWFKESIPPVNLCGFADETSSLNENSFRFDPCTLDDIDDAQTLSVVFTAKRKARAQAPSSIVFIDSSYSRPPVTSSLLLLWRTWLRLCWHFRTKSPREIISGFIRKFGKSHLPGTQTK